MLIYVCAGLGLSLVRDIVQAAAPTHTVVVAPAPGSTAQSAGTAAADDDTAAETATGGGGGGGGAGGEKQSSALYDGLYASLSSVGSTLVTVRGAQLNPQRYWRQVDTVIVCYAYRLCMCVCVVVFVSTLRAATN